MQSLVWLARKTALVCTMFWCKHLSRRTHTPPSDPEFAAGMRSLQGTGVARNSAEAAHHLWQSVKNRTAQALVVLAGLYAQGDGVAKDCDQAKSFSTQPPDRQSHTPSFKHVETARASLRTSGCE